MNRCSDSRVLSKLSCYENQGVLIGKLFFSTSPIFNQIFEAQ